MPTRLLQSVPNKRDFLARTLDATGGLRLLERLARRRRSLAVLTYHRIAPRGDGADPYYDPVVSATPDRFRGHMRLVRDRFQVLRLDDLADPSKIPGSPRPPALVTFDDGYRDNHDAALPILEELGVPATFFIPTDFLERPRLPWWDHVAYVLKSTAVPRLILRRTHDDDSPLLIDVDPADRARAVARVVRSFLAGEIADEAAFLEGLGAQAEVAVDSRALGRDLFMTWEHLRRLVDLGHSIGSHGHGHVALAGLPGPLQRRELALSRTILEAAAGRPVKAVAYPYGWPGAFSARTVELAADAGYALGFTGLEGVNRLDAIGRAPLALRRLNIGGGDTPALLRARSALHAAAGRSWL